MCSWQVFAHWRESRIKYGANHSQELIPTQVRHHRPPSKACTWHGFAHWRESRIKYGASCSQELIPTQVRHHRPRVSIQVAPIKTLIHHCNISRKIDPTCTQGKTGMVAYLSVVQPIAFGVSFNLISNLNIIGLFSTKHGRRDIKNLIIDWALRLEKWPSECNKLY